MLKIKKSNEFMLKINKKEKPLKNMLNIQKADNNNENKEFQNE